MALSQPATFNEVWSDARIASFLELQPPTGEDPDFHVLNTAYKHMRADDFARMLVLFDAQGRNRHARNAQGRTLHDVLSQHPKSHAFSALLASA